jgi:hypothetical protein
MGETAGRRALLPSGWDWKWSNHWEVADIAMIKVIFQKRTLFFKWKN